MSVITIQSLELTNSQKKELAESFISKFSELTKVPPDKIYLFFDGYQLDEVATNGMLFSEKPPKTAIGKFNENETKKQL